MPRTPGPGLQLSWLDGGAIAWQPSRGIYGGNLQQELTSLGGREVHRQANRTDLVRLEIPGDTVEVMCQRLHPGSLMALGRLGPDDGVSASVAWFGAVFRLAEELVHRGRVVPRIDDVGPAMFEAIWVPLPGDLERTEDLRRRMPPVVAAGGQPVVIADILRLMTDQLARQALVITGWNASVTDTRTPAARATRAVAKALSTPSAVFAVPPDLSPIVRQIAHEFELMTQRADGLPVVRARLRLAMPAAPTDDDVLDLGARDLLADLEFDLDPDLADSEGWERRGPDPVEARWPLGLEIVDADDRSRWCTADDVRLRTDAALLVAGDQRYLARLDEPLEAALSTIRTAVPQLASWLEHSSVVGSALGPDPGTVSLEAAAALLQAIDDLAGAGIEVIVPQSLVKRTPSTRGTVQAHDRDDAPGPSRFNTNALVEWTMVVGGEEVPEAVLQRAAEEGATLLMAGGRWVQVDRAEARRALARLAEHRADHSELSPLQLLALAAEMERTLHEAAARSEATDVAAIDALDGDTLSGTGWAAELLGSLDDAHLHDGVVPDGFTATLRPYQLRGLGWLQFLRRLGLGGCLADDMGLGKTPTTLAHLAGLPGPHLVVCPLSVVRNWQSEAARFAPLMRTMIHHGTQRLDAAELAAEAADHDLVITTYQVAARDLPALQGVAWSTLVLDEAQAVKNPDTKTAKAARAIPAEQKLALTGTPIENRLGELWSIFHTVVPGLLGSSTSFRSRFAAPIERQRDARAAAELRRLTAPFLLRRTKADKSLVPDLPDKVEQVAWAPLTREQAQMYQAVVDHLLAAAEQAEGMKRRGLVLAALTRLKQVCNHPAHALGDGSKLSGRSGKLHRFDEIVDDILDTGEQALVFTQFAEMGTLLQQHLAERLHLSVPFLHGGVTRAHRDRMVEQFQAGTSTSPLLLVSLKAGGTGLNLTAASQVVHYDRWWNPAVEDQATDRAWRIGQKRAVLVHKLVCEGTVEERIDALINDKRSLAGAVVGAQGEAWVSELDNAGLRDLVTLSPHVAHGGRSS
ncbi:MAG: hypothetical protein RLZ04_1355 [Actinomycetota bacterium]